MHLTTFTREKVRDYRPLLAGTLPMSASSSTFTLVQDPQPCNVIIFGESGAGKSSVVNLIAGKTVAQTSPNAGACTLASKSYRVTLKDGKQYRIWDTIGLNEPELLAKDYLRSIKHAYKLVKDLERSGGVHLLLLCMHSRVTRSVQQNYNLFVDVLCETNVPVAAVITKLENEESMEGWWTKNNHVFKKYRMSFSGHACITAISGNVEAFKTRREESKERMHKLLMELTTPGSKGGWSKGNAKAWFTDLLGKMMNMLPRRAGHPISQPTNKGLVDKLINDCKFSKREASDIANAIMEVHAQSGEGGDGI